MRDGPFDLGDRSQFRQIETPLYEIDYAAKNPRVNRRLGKADWLHTSGGKGSHRKFAHSDSQSKIILSGASGADAHHYQEKLVKAAIREVRK